ncbi:MAG: peptide chain release factor 1 [Deltaproteobacteria bacterium]|nr:peptide chain release factor 1 [Deltaproteobacteria bacterium]
MFNHLDAVKQHFEAITAQLADPAVMADQERYRKLSKEHNTLAPLMASYDRFTRLEKELADQRHMLDDPAEDPELKSMVRLELPALEARYEAETEILKKLLVPKDPLDDADIVLEIRAGAGGNEAALFAADLFRLYQRYAENQGWKVEVLGSSPSDLGGFKEIIMGIEGQGVYRHLKFESGVHRVQRVPETEAQGRIHTSTATVAVLPEAEDVEVDINPSELRVDVFRSSGPGGQSVNTTDSAVRITHLPTGLVVQCQDEKSQHKNKAKALKVLRARLLERAREEQQAKESAQRKSMVGTGDRSERIRTYNFPQGRLTDHRIGLTVYRLEQIMEGNLEEVVTALLEADQAERLKAHGG